MNKHEHGYDPSTDYSRYPTLSPLPEALLAQRPKASMPALRHGSVFQVAEGRSHTAVLLPDGTVYAYGDNQYGQCDVSDWRGVICVAAYANRTVGLFADGTVKTVGQEIPYASNYDTSKWTNIVAVATDGDVYGLLPDGSWMKTDFFDQGPYGNDNCISITSGRGVSFLLADGTLEGSWYTGRDDEIRSWKNIVKVAASQWHIVGLCADGTVKAVCYDYRGDTPVHRDGMYAECHVDAWSNIKDIAVSNVHTVGLCADGTLKATGYNKKGQCNVRHLKNVKAIAVSDHHTVALLSNGKVEAVGDFSGSNRCNVFDWSDVAEIWAARDFTAARRHDGTFLCTDAGIQKRINEACS